LLTSCTVSKVSGTKYVDMIFNSFGLVTSRDVVQTKKVWKRTQKLGIFKQLQTDFKGVFNKVMKNVWERRSHAFPPHYTPGYKGIDIYVVMRFSHCAIFEKESGFILPSCCSSNCLLNISKILQSFSSILLTIKSTTCKCCVIKNS